ncbi:MAG: orotidine-5'-phosphate decarboxylase [Myxococcota bacterium]
MTHSRPDRPAHALGPHFADGIVRRVRELGHPLCAGLDPHLAAIPPLFRRGSMAPADPATAEAVETFLLAFVERLAGRVAVAKPQIAFFEQLGWRGWRVLERVCAALRESGVGVLMDAKRGDIGSTAEGYARAFLAADAATPCDALTVNPYLGSDSLAPLVETAREAGRGLFVLVKTSNPGSGDLQDRTVDGAPLYEAVARMLAPVAEAWKGPETGWSSLGVVVGATYPEEAPRIRALLPRSLMLVPGYGAQGGGAADALRGFVPGPSGLEGGLVNSSRGLLFPKGSDTDDAGTWERALDAALDAAIDDLGRAVSG